MDIATKDDQNLVPNPVSSVSIGAERGSVGVPEVNQVPLDEFVKRSAEQMPVKIPQDVASAGVTQGQDGLKFSQSAIQAGVVPANPSISTFEGLTLPFPIEKARKIAQDGDPEVGDSNIAKIEVREYDRSEKKAA